MRQAARTHEAFAAQEVRAADTFHLQEKYYFIIFRQERASSSSVEHGVIWHRLAIVWMLAI